MSRQQQNSFQDRFFLSFRVGRWYRSGVDTKKQIDDGLVRIGKDRRWLAEKSGYSYFSVRDCLAPEGKKLSNRMRERFLDEIRKEETSESLSISAPAPPDRITVEVDPERMGKYCEAAAYARQDLKSWAINELNRAADAWIAEKNRSNISVVAEGFESSQSAKVANDPK
jgi:hypothetical protein